MEQGKRGRKPRFTEQEQRQAVVEAFPPSDGSVEATKKRHEAFKGAKAKYGSGTILYQWKAKFEKEDEERRHRNIWNNDLLPPSAFKKDAQGHYGFSISHMSDKGQVGFCLDVSSREDWIKYMKNQIDAHYKGRRNADENVAHIQMYLWTAHHLSLKGPDIDVLWNEALDIMDSLTPEQIDQTRQDYIDVLNECFDENVKPEREKMGGFKPKEYLC